MKLKRITLKVPKPYQLILFSILATSWFSGLTFFILNQFVTVEGNFGPQKHPLQFPAISLHGFAAFMMMIIFGAMLASHVPQGWRTKKIRFWSIAFITAISFQILSGYTLYYLASDFNREITKYLHLFVGFFLPVILTIHIKSAIKSRIKNKKTITKKSRNTILETQSKTAITPI